MTAVKNHGVTTLSQLAFAECLPGQPWVDATKMAFFGQGSGIE